MKSAILFAEKQRFTQLWIRVILIGINALFIFGLTQQVLSGKAFGDNPMPDVGAYCGELAAESCTMSDFTTWLPGSSEKPNPHFPKAEQAR